MVEGARLEIVWGRKTLGGSNPLASARIHILKTSVFFCFINTIFETRTRTFGANPLASARNRGRELALLFLFLKGALRIINPLASAREHILEKECVFYYLEIVFKIRTRTFGANPLASARFFGSFH